MTAARLSCLVLLLALPVAAQERDKLPPGQEDLPIGFSPEELQRLDQIGAQKAVTAPPVGPVRAAAEWDEAVGVFCLWSNADLMKNLELNNDLYIITTDSAWWLNWLASNGIPSGNVHFLDAPTNTFWVRDYGPWFIWDGNHDFGLVDNTYNRPRPLDDVIPGHIASTYGIPFYEMDLTHTGGNYYTDGYGTGLSTSLVQKENPTKTKAQIDQIFADYLGIDRYLNPELNYDIQHIDTFGKLLAPDSLVWGEFPVDTTPWIYCEAALKSLSTLQSPFGWPYKIRRFPLFTYGGSWAGYINALQSSGKIFMAKYGTANDDTAAALFEAAAPGWQVVKVSSGGTNWGDSVHCRTRNFIRGDAVRIYPMPHWEMTDDDVHAYRVGAEVCTDPGTSLLGSPLIHWTTTGGAPFGAVAMVPTGDPDEYEGYIPAQPHGTTISYYLHAEDALGRTKDMPIVAPAGMYTITVLEDAERPDLDHDAIHGLMPGEWPVTVECTSLDECGIPSVTLEYRIDGVPQPTVTMTRQHGTFLFTGQMTGAVSLGDVISYRILATDDAVPANTAASPPFGWHQFPITTADDILVIELDASPDTGSVLVDACDDLGLNVQYTTTWPTSLADYDTLLVCLGMTPTNKALTTAQANALVSFLNAGGNVYMEGGNAWAQDSTWSIYRSYFGLSGASSGANLPATVSGVAGEVTDGMSFGYSGERNSSDHLTPLASAVKWLDAGGQAKAVAWSTGTYATVASSLQLGSLVERFSPGHIKYLTSLVLEALGTDLGLVVHNGANDPLEYTFDLSGDPWAGFMLFWSAGPGWLPLGAKGVLQLDPSTMSVLLASSLGADGTLRFAVDVPADPLLDGVELFMQVYRQDTSTSIWSLTNRDHITLAVP